MKSRKSKIIWPLTHVLDVGPLHWYKDCTFRNKKCFIFNRVGYKSSYYQSKNKTNCYVKNTKLDEQDGANTRKFVHVKMFPKSVNFQLNSGSDLTLTNLQAWKRLGKPTIIKSSKIARPVTGEKLKSRQN